MAAPAWLWVALTLVAAGAQVFRNAAQRGLTDTLGTAGATHVRFLFGLPFGLLGVAVVTAFGHAPPAPNFAWLAWTAGGGLCQIAATAMMLAAMRERSFVVTTAYVKTEPVQTALFVVLVLGDRLSLAAVAAIVTATAGVLVMSWPARADAAWRPQPAVLGVAAGGAFGMSAVCFRGGIDALASPDFLAAAIATVALALALQSALLTAWLAVRQPGVLQRILRHWRPSLAAGFLGAFASQMWFLAFAIENPARVRTLGLVEILFAGFISGRFFREPPSRREIAGIAIMVAGIAVLVAG